MKIELADKKRCGEFINIFSNLKHFTDSINLMISEDKLYIQGMDQSHVCVYELFLEKQWFHLWEVSTDETYGFQLSMFNKILHTYSDTQTIRLEGDIECDKLRIEFTSHTKSDFNKFFEIPLMEINCELLHIPVCDYEVDLVMESKKFKSLIDELSHFNDTVTFRCDEGEFFG